MLKVQRLAIVWSATIFFLIISPVLAFYALGYDFDIKKNNLKNTITLSVESLPDNANIQTFGSFGKIEYLGNNDFRIPTKDQLKVKISKDGFLYENFWVKGQKDGNSLARLKKIHLLPILDQKLGSYGADWSDISFVSKDYILFSKVKNDQKTWYLQQYSYSGFLGESKEIAFYQSQNLPIDLDVSTSKEFNNITKNSFWEEIEFDTFWQKETQSILFKDQNGEWKFWQSKFLGLGNLETIWLGQDLVLLHDKINTKNLYTYDLNTDKLSYITDNINAVSLNSNQVWFWIENRIYKLSKDEIYGLSGVDWSLKKGFSLSGDTKFGTKSSFENFNKATLYSNNFDFKVKNVYQGLMIFINGQIYYQSDSQTEKWVLISSQAKYWTSTWHSIFWINDSNELVTYNLELNYERTVAMLDFNVDDYKILNLDYYAPWHRIFIYKINRNDPNSDTEISSIWYNPDFVNEQIRTFSQNLWLKENVCRSFVEGGYIFCLKQDKTFISFRNLN